MVFIPLRSLCAVFIYGAHDLKQAALCTKQDFTPNQRLQPKHFPTFGMKFPQHPQL